jgi:hypothetical protein
MPVGLDDLIHVFLKNHARMVEPCKTLCRRCRLKGKTVPA